MSGPHRRAAPDDTRTRANGPGIDVLALTVFDDDPGRSLLGRPTNATYGLWLINVVRVKM
jgi:hypothetical protein